MNQNNNIPIFNIDTSYPRRNNAAIMERDCITNDITKLRPDLFLTGPDAFEKSIASLDKLIEEYAKTKI